MQMEKVEFDDDVLAGPEEARSYEPEQPADGQAAVEGSAAYDPEDPFGLDRLLPTKKKGGKRGSQQELVQQPVPSLHSGAAHSVSSAQVGESSAAAGSEEATTAVHGAAGEVAMQDHRGGGSEDREEGPSAERLGVNGQADDSANEARLGPAVAERVGYLNEGTAVRVFGLTRSVQYNGATGVVDYTHQTVEGDEEEQKLVRVAVSIEHEGEVRQISVPQGSLEVVAADSDAGANGDESGEPGWGEPRRVEGRHT